jgi:nucleoside 2-deoxyribosyltransferase
MIYIAAPLFNPRERAFNLKLKAIIGRSVYLPQEDGELMENLIRRGETVEYAADLVYKNDLRALHASEAMVAVLDGAHLDSGVAFEIGFFNALGKPVVGLHTDSRSELSSGHNPMIAGALYCVVRDESKLPDIIEDCLRHKA